MYRIFAFAGISLFTLFLTACGGTQMLYYSESDPGTYLVTDDGSEVIFLTSSGHSPTISPDGEQLVYVNNNSQLVLRNLNSSSESTITDPTGGIRCPDSFFAQPRQSQFCWFHSPRFSPDGTEVAFIVDFQYHTTPQLNGRLGVVQLDTLDFSFNMPSGGLSPLGIIHAPAYSPDGSQLVFSAQPELTGDFQQPRDQLGRGDIYVMDANGGSAQKLTSGGQFAQPAWGSFGNLGERIVYVSHEDDYQQIHWMRPTGSQKERLTDNSHNDFSPAVWPGTPLIAVLSDRPSDVEGADVYTLEIDGTEHRRLTTDGGSKNLLHWAVGD
ncbi:MAG: hypothetical protein LAT62_10595 [Natronospirillum sp.]|uniref:TolB family protein n=1 Tax=Natronospirillum sp. TaxID=2812955 RepID=UPI0025F82408|nr:hypothetical protein [Natronospirillum sp.]MCH8552376.1 hypothetical protein [Natronospirillum sp.]